MAAQQISWMTLSEGVPITTSDGAELGRVHEVVADRQKDIFSGITFKDGILGGDTFVPAAVIDDITTEEVKLSISSAESKERLEPYEG